MATEIYLVKVGMTMHEGTVDEWYIGDGERVESGGLLYRLETEKVNLDVDAETSGTVKQLVSAGTTLEPGDVVGYIYADGETIPDVLPAPTPKRDISVREESPPAQAAPPAAPAEPAPERKRVAASPVARKLAAELNVDLATVNGTGPRGRITKEDVQQAAALIPAAAPPATLTPAAAPPAAAPSANAVPLRGMRKTIAERMHASLRDSAQLTITMEAAMDEAVKLRQSLNDEWQSAGIRVTYTDLVLTAATKALRQHPAMNAALIDDAIARFDAVHIGVAVALDEGLIVPVVKDAHAKSLRQIAVEAADLAGRARAGKLAIDDVEGGTFTVTSLGMYGVDGFTPILNPPQAGILGVGRLYDGVRWHGDRPAKEQRLRLSLTWDHRVIDGAPAAEFLATVRGYLESPFRLLV